MVQALIKFNVTWVITWPVEYIKVCEQLQKSLRDMSFFTVTSSSTDSDNE